MKKCKSPWCGPRSAYLGKKIVHLFTSKYNDQVICSWCGGGK